MKILILGPIDYPSARQDLILLNYNQNIYSSLFVFEGLYSALTRENVPIESQTSMILYLSEALSEKEYNSSEIHFGLVPKKYSFDKIICYNFDILSTQEARLKMDFKDFEDKFYTTKNVTDKVDNIMEAIKLAQSKTEGSNRKSIK